MKKVIPMAAWSAATIRDIVSAHLAKGYRCIPARDGAPVPGCGYGRNQQYPADSKYWKRANMIALALGPGMLLLDHDGYKVGAADVEDAEAELGWIDLSECLVQYRPEARSDHYLVRVDESLGPFLNKAGWLPGWDVKTSNNGLMFLKPDKVIVGGSLPELDELVMLSPEAMERLPKKKDRVFGTEEIEPVLRVAAEDELVNAVDDRERMCAELAAMGEDTGRNNMLNRHALVLLSMACGGQLDIGRTRDLLLVAAMDSGLGRDECMKTIASAEAKARTQPRVARDPFAEMDELSELSGAEAEVGESASEGTGEETSPTDGDTTKAKASGPHAESEDWKTQLLLNSKGGLMSNSVHNALLVLRHQELMQDVLRFNAFAMEVEIVSRAPWDGDGDKVPRKLSDTDCTRAGAWLERKGLKLGVDVIHKAMVSVAHTRSYDPLVAYLDELEWDGVARLDGWLEAYLGVVRTEFSVAVARRFLVAAVARALDPGCKVDTMLILEGPQGNRKSTAVATLFKGWFTDELDDLGSKDSALQLQGVWCVEMGELSNLTRAESGRAKQWISRRVDRFRPPYGRNMVEYPRRCVLVGTVNPEGGYLKDATGGRRFWPVVCGEIDLAGLAEARDQLWAEARVLYDAGERWWLEGDEEKAALDVQHERYEEDAWSVPVLKYCDKRDEVTLDDILEFALNLDHSKQTRLAQIRVGKILVSSGIWKRIRKRVGKRRDEGRQYVYVRREIWDAM